MINKIPDAGQQAASMLLVAMSPEQERLELCSLLSGEYETESAANAEETLLALQAEPHASLVILNTDGDGLSLLRQIRSIPHFRGLAVVAIAGTDTATQNRALDAGATDIMVRPFNEKLVLQRIHNIAELCGAWRPAEKDSAGAECSIPRHMQTAPSETDELTGLYTRAAFLSHTEKILKSDPEHRYVIVRWDIDHFKVFNDIYGTKEGDRFLREFGKTLMRYHRPGSTLGHWDADHFVTCLRAEKLDADKMSKWLCMQTNGRYPDFEFIFKIGIYEIDDPSVDISIMCDRAHLALRSIKKGFKTRYAYYKESMRISMLQEQEIMNELKTAFEKRQFIIYLQPQYNYAENTLIGAETLVRWQHPQKGLVMPGVFIPVLERNELIIQLDTFVWEESCRLLRKWLDSGIDPPSISVNISRADVYDPRLIDIITSLVEKYRLEPRYLHLEITESAYIETPEQLVNIVEKLRSLGFTIAMDDFGSGYSSLNTLKDVPVDILKLDMKFLSRGNSMRGGSILSSIVRMAHWLKLPVIAEGVETVEQANYLKSIGCSLMQGYYFARPMPVAEYEKKLTAAPADLFPDIYKDTEIGAASDFWDVTAQSALIFNSFVGGAAIVEWAGDRVEALRINDRYLEILSSSRENYIKYQRNILDRIYDDSIGAVKDALNNAIKSGEETSCEIHNKPLIPGGDDLWLLMHVRFLAKNIDSYIFYISLENITNRKTLEAENLRLSARLTNVMNSVPCGIFTFESQEGKIHFSYSNEKAPEIFGFTREELNALYNSDPISAVHEADKGAVLAAINSLINGTVKTAALRYRHITKNGDYKLVRAQGCLMDPEGRTHPEIAVVLDPYDYNFSEEEQG